MPRNSPGHSRETLTALWFLSDLEGHRIETNEIAEEIGLSRSATYLICRKLHRWGLIRREVVPTPTGQIALWSINLRAPKKPDHKDSE